MESSINELLFETLTNISSIEDLDKWCVESPVIKNICDDDIFWEKRFNKDYPNLMGLNPAPGETYKNLYRSVYSGVIWKHLRTNTYIKEMMAFLLTT